MQAASPTKIFIGSSSKSDTPGLPSSAGTEAAAVASQMEVYAAIASSDQFPCTSSMRPSDVGALLSWERLKTLLANPTPGAIESIGSALGVKVVVEFQVTQYGGQTTISGSASNTKTGAGIARNTMTVPNNGDMADAMEAFANSLVASMGGGIKCDPSTGWKGTVTITFGISGKLTDQKNNPAQGTSSFSEQCDIKGSNAHCTITFTSSASGKDTSFSSQANGTADTSASVTTYKGRTAIEIGTVKIKGNSQVTTGREWAAPPVSQTSVGALGTRRGRARKAAPPFPAPRRSTASPFPGTSRCESAPDRRAEGSLGAWSMPARP